MALLIRLPGLASLVLTSRAAEIEALIGHPSLDRAFVGEGRFVNRLLVSRLQRQTRHRGEVLDAFRPRQDETRKARQQELFDKLDRHAEATSWPSAPIVEMARYVVEGRERKAAEAALAYAIAWPFLGENPVATEDDAYKVVARQLWRLHRRMARARRPLSVRGLAVRCFGLDRRARTRVLAMTQGDDYGLHAVEITLANARFILEQMRLAAAGTPGGRMVSARDLAWAAIRTAPELVVRQSGPEPTTLPHVPGRVPPHTLVLMRMRRGLEPDADSGYEFASHHWSACPARRYVMSLFATVAETAADLARSRVGQ